MHLEVTVMSAAPTRARTASFDFARVADALACAIVVAVVAAIAWRWFGAYAFDDSFVGFSIAQNLVEGRGFTFESGSTVLATSAPLAPLVYATAARAGIDILTAASVLALLALLTVGLSAYALARKIAGPGPALATALAACANPYVVPLWSHESLVALACSLAAAACAAHRRFAFAGVLLAAGTFMREEVLFAIVVMAVLGYVRSGLRAGALLLAGAVPFGVWALVATLRFGHFTSVTMLVKQALARYAPFQTYWQGLHDYTILAFATSLGSVSLAVVIAALFTILTIALCARAVHAWYLALVIWTVVVSALYCVSRVSFFLWFAPQFGVLIAATVLLGFSAEVARLSSLARAIARAAAVSLTAVSLAFGAFVLAHPSLSRPYTGYVPQARYREGSYLALAAWLRSNTPADATIGYEEPGQLHYFSRRRIIDFQGMTDAGVADRVARGDASWSVRALRPTYFIIDRRRPNVVFAPLQFDWFRRAYARVADLRYPGESVARRHFAVFKLVAPAQIPPADDAVGLGLGPKVNLPAGTSALSVRYLAPHACRARVAVRGAWGTTFGDWATIAHGEGWLTSLVPPGASGPGELSISSCPGARLVPATALRTVDSFGFAHDREPTDSAIALVHRL
jgi:hypothetical protein